MPTEQAVTRDMQSMNKDLVENRKLVEHIFASAPFIRALSMKLTGCGSGWCEARLELQPSHMQQHGFAHAGVLMSLADHTCGGAAASLVPEGMDVITVENKTSFLRPAVGSVLFCRAQVLRAGKTLMFVEAEIHVDRGDERFLVVKSSSTLAVIAGASGVAGNA